MSNIAYNCLQIENNNVIIINNYKVFFRGVSMKKFSVSYSMYLIIIGMIFLSTLCIFPNIAKNSQPAFLETNQNAITNSNPITANPNETLESSVVLFCYDDEYPEVAPGEGEDSDLEKFTNSFYSYNQKTLEFIERVSNGITSFSPEIVYSDYTNAPLLLKIPRSTSSGNLRNTLYNTLSEQTLDSDLKNGGDKTTFIYLNYKTYDINDYALNCVDPIAYTISNEAYSNDFLERTKANNDMFWAKYIYTSTSIPFSYNTMNNSNISSAYDECMILHSDFFTASNMQTSLTSDTTNNLMAYLSTTNLNIVNQFIQGLEKMARADKTYFQGVYCHELLHMYGLPDLYYNDASSEHKEYAGAWDLMSSGSIYSGVHPYQQYKLGWLDEENVIKITKQGIYSISKSENTLYLIESDLFPGQSIAIYYKEVDSTWKENTNFDSQSGIIVSRVDMRRTNNDESLPFISASSTYAPIYIYTPSTLARTMNDDLADASLQVGESVGNNTSLLSSANITPEYLAFYNQNGEYENSTIRLTVSDEDSDNIYFTLECARIEILNPNNLPDRKYLTSFIPAEDYIPYDEENPNLDFGALIALYNIYVQYYHEELKAEYNVLNLSCNVDPNNLTQSNLKAIFENQILGDMDKSTIFGKITNIDKCFVEATTLDLQGQGIVGGEIFKHIPFVNIQSLGINGIDMSPRSGSNSWIKPLSFINSLTSLVNLEMVSCHIDNLSELSDLTNLKTLVVMDNQIEDFSIIRNFQNLEYANIMLNQADPNLLAQSQASLYASSVVDVGLQLLPNTSYVVKGPAFYFKDSVTISRVSTQFNSILSCNGSFIIPSPKDIGTINMINLQHGVYEIHEIEYLSCVSSGDIKSIASRSFLNINADFSYSSEHVCQNTTDNLYNTSLSAYNNLNPLNNISTSDAYFDYENITIGKSKELGTSSEIIDNIYLDEVGTYQLTYALPLKTSIKEAFGIPENDVVNNIANGSLIVSKKLIVYSDNLIEFDETSTNGSIISNEKLYIALLKMSDDTLNISRATAENLGKNINIDGFDYDFRLHEQDFYFFGVEDKYTPVVETSLGVLSILDFSTTLKRLYQKVEISLGDLQGLNALNLKGIKTINLNSLGVTSIDNLLTKDLIGVKVLNLANNAIENINGIENLCSLEYLDLSYNMITSASCLENLINPGFMNAKGETKQNLKLANLAFNRLSLYGSDRRIDDVSYLNNFGSAENRFLISNETPENEGFKSASDTFIVLIQYLYNFDHFVNTAKFEYYYTNAIYYKDTDALYALKISGNSALPPATQNIANRNEYTNYDRVKSGYISVTFTKATGASSIPFEDVGKTMYYTITTIQQPTASYKFTNYASTLYERNSGTDYYILSTEWEDMTANLALSDINAKASDIRYTFGVSGTALNIITRKVSILPSQNLSTNKRYIYKISLYSYDKDHPNVENGITDFINLSFTMRVIENFEISIADKNLKNALIGIKRNYTNDKIYMYDFYHETNINLSQKNISTFEPEANYSASNLRGFESIQFKNLLTLDLSRNNIENTEELGTRSSIQFTDPLYAVLNNTTLKANIEYINLSYNKITYLQPFHEAGLLENPEKPLIINLFANILDITKSSNTSLLNAPWFATSTCKIFFGLQGINSTQMKMVSFLKNIERSSDTDAKIYLVNGNITEEESAVYDMSGLVSDEETVEYKNLCTMFYCKEAKTYSISYAFSYENIINEDFRCQIIHQKIYLNSVTYYVDIDVEFCPEAKADSSQELKDRYAREHSYALQSDYRTEEDLANNRNIFTYENCDPSDFTFNYTLSTHQDSENSISDSDFKLYQLTKNVQNSDSEDNFYIQKYIITHNFTNKSAYRFSKRIHVVDTTKPVIVTTHEDSKQRYIITTANTEYYNYYHYNHVDKDLAVLDEYNTEKNITPYVYATITKDGKTIYTGSNYWDQVLQTAETPFSININEPGIYEMTYIVIDASGNRSEPFVRTIELYYKPFEWVRLSSSTSQFSAGYSTFTANVYKSLEDSQKNANPVFYWYIDGKHVATTTKDETLSSQTNLKTQVDLMIEGAGTHTVTVYVDHPKEFFEIEGVSSVFATSSKSTTAYVLMDNEVLIKTLIGLGVFVAFIIVLLLVLNAKKRAKERTRNKYDYTIIKK